MIGAEGWRSKAVAGQNVRRGDGRVSQISSRRNLKGRCGLGWFDVTEVWIWER